MFHFHRLVSDGRSISLDSQGALSNKVSGNTLDNFLTFQLEVGSGNAGFFCQLLSLLIIFFNLHSEVWNPRHLNTFRVDQNSLTAHSCLQGTTSRPPNLPWSNHLGRVSLVIYQLYGRSQGRGTDETWKMWHLASRAVIVSRTNTEQQRKLAQSVGGCFPASKKLDSDKNAELKSFWWKTQKLVGSMLLSQLSLQKKLAEEIMRTRLIEAPPLSNASKLAPLHTNFALFNGALHFFPSEWVPILLCSQPLAIDNVLAQKRILGVGGEKKKT